MVEAPAAGDIHPESSAPGQLSGLPDYLRPGLDLVLCGCNPGLFSAAVGHYFARRGNAFWPLLAEAGITPRLFAPDEDCKLPELGIGLTDVVARPTIGTAGVSGREWQSGGALLAERLRRYRPAAVCFVGDTAYRAFSSHPRARWGRQPRPWDGMELFVVPSTSGRVTRPAAERLAAFQEVGDWLRLRRSVPSGYNANSPPRAAGSSLEDDADGRRRPQADRRE
jgi:double-stranded uracil-DNA glycosylase